MITEELVGKARDFALSEIEKFGLPTTVHFDIAYKKGIELAKILHADELIVRLGLSLMDIKLGEAFSEGRVESHIEMGIEASKKFLADFELTTAEKNIVLNCVEAHHGKVPFTSLEAEIVANADCYRFIHPTGVLHYIGVLSKRFFTLEEVIQQAENKLDEKKTILSLKYCQNELNDHYLSFKKIFAATRQS